MTDKERTQASLVGLKLVPQCPAEARERRARSQPRAAIEKAVSERICKLERRELSEPRLHDRHLHEPQSPQLPAQELEVSRVGRRPWPRGTRARQYRWQCAQLPSVAGEVALGAPQSCSALAWRMFVCSRDSIISAAVAHSKLTEQLSARVASHVRPSSSSRKNRSMPLASSHRHTTRALYLP